MPDPSSRIVSDVNFTKWIKGEPSREQVLPSRLLGAANPRETRSVAYSRPSFDKRVNVDIYESDPKSKHPSSPKPPPPFTKTRHNPSSSTYSSPSHPYHPTGPVHKESAAPSQVNPLRPHHRHGELGRITDARAGTLLHTRPDKPAENFVGAHRIQSQQPKAFHRKLGDFTFWADQKKI